MLAKPYVKIQELRQPFYLHKSFAAPTAINIKPFPYVGAMLSSGISLAKGGMTSTGELQCIRDCLSLYGVVVIKRQNNLQEKDLLAFGESMGTIETHAFVQGMKDYPQIIEIKKAQNETPNFGERWHADNSFQKTPSKFSIVYGKAIPKLCNATSFSCMTSLYEHISYPIQQFLKTLYANHTASQSYDETRVQNRQKNLSNRYVSYANNSDLRVNDRVVHPVIITHPTRNAKVYM